MECPAQARRVPSASTDKPLGAAALGELLHVLSPKTFGCMFEDGSKTTSHHTLAATSSCRHSLSRPHPTSTSSAIITSACSSSHDRTQPRVHQSCTCRGARSSSGKVKG